MNNPDEATTTNRILCVDDESSVLEGLERVLFDRFQVDTATSGAEGLELIKSDGPYSAVVSDMRMPGMNGAEFLAEVSRIAPDSSRILLTGQTDLESAIAAVNEGSIFRFLCKPCSPEHLEKSLDAAVAQYSLLKDRKELLDKTLKGSVQVLTDVLSLVAPKAFSQASTIRQYVSHMSENLGLKDRWQYELAAMLSQLGCITLPTECLDKVYAGVALSENEAKMFEAHPQIGYRLLKNIPRFDRVAEIIKSQNSDEQPTSQSVKTGARMLTVALKLNGRVTGGESFADAVAGLKAEPGADLELLDIMLKLKRQTRSDQYKAVRLAELRSFMVLEEDIQTLNGNVIVSKGHELNPALIERLANFQSGVGVMEPIRVCIPASAA